jgi:hypothetical protein
MNLIAFSTRFCQILILLDLRLPKIDGCWRRGAAVDRPLFR